MGSQLPHAAVSLKVEPIRRWEVYHRLQSLGIACQYETGKCLNVEFENPLSAIQCWCVLRRLTRTRAESIDWLESCWHLEVEEWAN
ncbi:Asr1405/Asl0597 family protein [Rubidibacter lacunae]